MDTEQDTIERAIELAAQGSPKEGMVALQPLMRDESTREDALYALAYCYEKNENFVTATYLYEWIVQRFPEATAALNRLDACRVQVKERDLIEDFEDAGHIPCACGLLRQRREYAICPYCARGEEKVEAADGWEEVELVVEDEPELVEGDASPMERLRKEGHDVVDRVQKWTEREELQPTMERLHLLKEETTERLKEFSEHEKVKRVSERAGEIGRETSERVKTFVESEPVQDATKKAKDMGHEASEKVKEISETPKVQEAKTKVERWGHNARESLERWIASDTVRGTLKKAATGFENFLAKIQAVIDKTKKS